MKTQMEGGGTSSRVNREQTYGLSRMTRQRMDSKVKREGRAVNADSVMVDGEGAQRRLETAAAFFMMQLFFSSIHTASSGLSALRGCCAAP